MLYKPDFVRGINKLAAMLKHNYKMNRIEYFRTHARSLFSILESEFEYTFEEEKIFRHADIDWSIELLYFNKPKNLKIVIEQAPYYTDYGFTFSVQNISSNENVMIYNIAHERQDSESKFLTNACELIFLNPEVVDLISGKKWQNYNRILIQQ
jgi:hypothetical protein